MILPRSRKTVLLPSLLLPCLLSSCGGQDGPDASAAQTPSPSPTAMVTVSTPRSLAPNTTPTSTTTSSTSTDPSFRRTLSPDQPMFVIHADTWNAADPQKIIDLIPADLRPYTVLLISLSISHNGATNNQCNWNQVENGIETARSWIKTAAANGVWAMVQPSSGGFSHFPDYPNGTDLESTVYGEFFRDYPNFLGFNYAEQFWGFDQPCSVSAAQRWEHWANLLKLTNKYGGYLAVSFTGGFWGANINPLAMVKRNDALRTSLTSYAKNFIIEEKFTMNYGYHDIESVSLGMFLSGFAGHYGIRPDSSGWYAADGSAYPIPAGAPHLIEHLTLTGETYFDGPELIWTDSVQSLPNGTTADGYNTRRWQFFPQFKNIHMDVYRKVLDGTLHILNRRQVIDRTKVVVVDDVKTGNDRAVYATPETLFSGLYLMDDDGTYLDQHSWYKKTGRYPAIPTVWQLNDDLAKSFPVQIKRSAYDSRWPSIAAKTQELNALFPQESTGHLYVGRQDNTWVTYNPYKTNKTASGAFNLKYNSCAALNMTYGPYTTGMVKEFANSVSIYLTNFDSETGPLKTDTITISGASSTPTYTFTDRGEHKPSSVTATPSNGGLTLKVAHNGPLDITIQCSGAATGRASAMPVTALQAPAAPPAYTGVRQYEAENFDFLRIGSLVANGVSGTVHNFQGLGYVDFGGNHGARLRTTVNVPQAGTYTLATRYSAPGASVGTVDLYVNGVRVGTPAFAQTSSASDWASSPLTAPLNAGDNVVEYRASAGNQAKLYLDNLAVSQ